MSLFFKEFAPPEGNRSMIAWISHSGNLAVMVDAAATAEPRAAVAACREFLDARDAAAEPGEIASLWPDLCALAAPETSLALFSEDQGTLLFQGRGSIACLRLENGALNSVPAGSTITLNKDDILLAVSDSLDAARLAQDCEAIERAGTTREFVAIAEDAAGGREWAMLAFPIEFRSSFIDPSWPYNPFVGFQEDRDHEKRGLADLATALFREPDFAGFRIVGGNHLVMGYTSRMVDGILVCRWGVFPLELKDYFGKGDFYPQNENARLRLTYLGEEHQINEAPAAKLEKVLRRGFSQLDVGATIQLNFRKAGLLVFTHPKLELTCIDGAGNRFGFPHLSGSVLICSPTTVAAGIRDYITGILSIKKPEQLLPDATVAEIVAHIGKTGATPPAAPADPGPDQPLRLGRFLVSQHPNPDESTTLYQVFDGVIAGKERQIWAKRFDLTTMGRGEDLEREAERLGREVAALQDLQHADGVQRVYDRITLGLHLYVIVERVGGVTLDAWLDQQQPSRGERLAMLVQLATLLSDLADEKIVHRALNPFNIRIGSDGRPKVINFELCQIHTVVTVVPKARELMNLSYLPKEALSPGARVTPATDTYSFGKLCCLALSGELPFQVYWDQSKAPVNRPGFWERFAGQCGLDAGQGPVMKRMMSSEQQLRPLGAELISIVKGWQ